MTKGFTVFGKDSFQAWRTPPDEFNYLNSVFDFTVDACADHDNHLLPKYWTKTDTCLDKDWSKERVFCNPEFSKLPIHILPLAKTAELALVILMLNQLTSKFFHKNKPNYLIIPNRRIKFLRGDTTSLPTFGVCYLLYSNYCPSLNTSYAVY